jgi:hypothetical protein
MSARGGGDPRHGRHTDAYVPLAVRTRTQPVQDGSGLLIGESTHRSAHGDCNGQSRHA